MYIYVYIYIYIYICIYIYIYMKQVRHGYAKPQNTQFFYFLHVMFIEPFEA